MDQVSMGSSATPVSKINYHPNGNGRLLLTRQELADYLGVSIKTIDDWRRRGGGAAPVAIMLGKLVRFDLSDVHAWEAGRKSASTSDRKGR